MAKEENKSDSMELRKATFNDWKLLLDWRNDYETRVNSHNMEIVKEEDHKKWLNSVLESEKRQLFLAVESGKSVGTVRADYDSTIDGYELSWTVSPDYRGRGVGKRMVRLAVEKLKIEVRAEIKKGNNSSVKIAEYAGMNFVKKEDGILHYSLNKAD